MKKVKYDVKNITITIGGVECGPPASGERIRADYSSPHPWYSRHGKPTRLLWVVFCPLCNWRFIRPTAIDRLTYRADYIDHYHCPLCQAHYVIERYESFLCPTSNIQDKPTCLGRYDREQFEDRRAEVDIAAFNRIWKDEELTKTPIWKILPGPIQGRDQK
jgi:hypothetical protein